MEKSNKEKSCLRKIFKSDGTIVVNPKSIMSELQSFYSNFYKEGNCLSLSFLDDLKEVPTLTEELRYFFTYQPRTKIFPYEYY